MWLEQRNGKYRYSERYSDPLTGKQRKASVTLDRKSDKKALEMLSELIKARTDTESGEYTVRQAADLYLAESAHSLRTATVRRNTDALNSVIKIIGSDCLMNKLKAGYIRSKLIASGKKAVTLNNYMIRFRTFIRWAFRNDYIESTACIDKMESFKDTPHRQKIQDKFLNRDELTALLNGMSDERNRLIVEFLALSGLRIGELIALDDADVAPDVIHVTKTFNPVTEELTPGKTLGSVRDVHIQPELADCIARIRKTMKVWKMAAGVPRSPLFMISLNGGRITYYAVNKYFKQKTKEIIGRELTIHALRHTHASLLAEQGYPLESISRRLGHDDSRITKEIYLHVTENIKKKDAEMMDKISILLPFCPQDNKKIAGTPIK